MGGGRKPVSDFSDKGGGVVGQFLTLAHKGGGVGLGHSIFG